MRFFTIFGLLSLSVLPALAQSPQVRFKYRATMCPTEAIYARYFSLLMGHDIEAASKLADVLCQSIAGGKIATTERVSQASGEALFCVRPEGDPFCGWTSALDIETVKN